MSFHKKIASASGPTVSKARHVHGSWKIASGIQTFDRFVDEGLAVGSLTIVIEDTSAHIARSFSQRFLQEGQKNGHANLFASLNHGLLDVPIGKDATVKENIRSAGEEDDSLKIAWRYKDLPKYVETSAPMEEIGQTGELSKIEEWKFEPGKGLSSYTELLREINLKAKEFQIKPGDVGEKNVLRLAIVSLGTVLWNGMSLQQFLALLKVILRKSCIVAMVTIPPFVVKKEPEILPRLRNLSDIFSIITRIDPDVHEELKAYSAVINIDFPNTLNAFHVNYPDTKDLAVRISRNQLIVEKVHLTPGIKEDEKKPVSRVDF